MEAFTNMLYFLIASGLFIAAWAAYLFLNNLLDKMRSGWLQEVLGIVLSFALLSSVMLILYFHAVSFSMGVVAIAVTLSVVYAVRTLIHGLMKKGT